MCNKEQLISYLYEDLNDMDRAKVEMHLRACEPCREEVEGLRGVRVDLAAWAPPPPDLGFRIVRDMKPAPPSWKSWLSPAAGLAAAAVLVLAAAASLAHIEVHRGPDGLTVRTGWSSAAPASVTAPQIAQAAKTNVLEPDKKPVLTATSQLDAAALQGIIRRVDALEAALRDAPPTTVRAALNARSSDKEMIKRVHEIIAQSEARQQGELALRLRQVINEFDAQRTADMARIQTSFGQLQGSVTAEAAAHRELTNYLFSSSNAKQQK